MNAHAHKLKHTAPGLDATVFPNTAKFMDWYQGQQKSRHLTDIKFFTGNVSGATLESFFGEVNDALSADSVPDNRPL